MWVVSLVSATPISAAKKITSLRLPAEAPPLALSAEYYVKNRQFERALDIYRQLLDQESQGAKYWERAATLALYVEGRASAQALVQRYLGTLTVPPSKRAADSLEGFLNSLFGTFTTDRGQALYLQGLVRAERGDCLGASPFFKQALGEDPSQLTVLKQQIRCLMRLENYPQAYESLKTAFAINPLAEEIAEPLSELHVYFGAPATSIETVHDYTKYKSATPRLLVAEAVSLARKTDREAAWQTFRKVDLAFAPPDLPAIVFWEKAKLLETDPRRKSALAKSQLMSWLKLFLKRSEKIAGFDPYRTPTFREEATTWLASLEAPKS